MRFDRRVPEQLMHALLPAGPWHWLVERALADRTTVDLHLRGSGTSGHVSLYKGLTRVISIHMSGNGWVKVSNHETYQRLAGFDPSWLVSTRLESASSWMIALTRYVDAVIEAVDPRHVSAEGRVQTALTAGISGDYTIIDKESVIAFATEADREAVITPLRATYLDPLEFGLGDGVDQLPESVDSVSDVESN